MQSIKNNNVKIWASLVALYILWGSTYLAIHFVVETCPPIIASALRNLLAGFIILAYLGITGKTQSLKISDLWHMLIAGVLMLTLGNGLLTIAAKWVPSGYMSLFPALVPAWIVIIQVFLGTKPNTLTIIGLALGFGGMFFLVNQEHLSIKGYEQYFGRGVIFLLLATLGWACGVMYSIKKPLPYTVAFISSLQMIAGGSTSLILSGLAGEWPHFQLNNLSQNTVYGFIYLLIFGSIAGFLIFNWVSKQASPTLVSTYSYVNPIVALFLGWLVLDENLNLNIVIAAGIIVVAVILITMGTNKKTS